MRHSHHESRLRFGVLLMSINRRAFLASAAVLALKPTARADDRLLSCIAFGSCANQDKPLPIFDVVAAQKPELLIMLGDNIYADLDKKKEVTVELIREKYQILSTIPGWQKLRGSCPMLATWDDHDYGKNDMGEEWPLKKESQSILLDFLGVPADSPRRKQEGVYHANIFGPPGKRVQVIMLDTRYFRSKLKRADRPDFASGIRVPPYLPNTDAGATMLGEEQWKWFEEQLKQPAEVRLIGSSVQAVHDEHPWEKWGNIPAERQRFFDLIRSTKASGVIVLSGDRHYAELSVDATVVGYPLYDATSSGFNQGFKEWRAPEKNSRRIGGMPYGDNFGLIFIDWSKPDPVITLQLRDVNGDVRVAHKLNLSELTAGRLEVKGPAAEPKLPAGVIGAVEARGKLGEAVTVQFTVRGGRAVSAGKRILLNSESDFRSEKNFTVVVESAAMTGAFDKATYDTFKSKTIRVKGTVKEYMKQIEIIVDDAKNLEIVE